MIHEEVVYKVTTEDGSVFWTDGDPIAEFGEGAQVEKYLATPAPEQE